MAKEIKRKPTIIGYIPEEVKEVEEPVTAEEVTTEEVKEVEEPKKKTTKK